MKYILNEKGEAEHCHDAIKWAKWFQTAKRGIAADECNGATVSTVFIGLSFELPPLVWETMIFDGPHDGHQVRAATKEEALKNHEEAKAIALGAA